MRSSNVERMNVERSTQNGERQRSLFVLLWASLIVAIVVPWYDWQDHPHWMNVVWRPFVDPPMRMLDVVLNIALYVPLGFAGIRRTGRTWLVVVLATGLSLLTELTQVYSHSRIPSLTDVVSNVAGAATGLMLAIALGRGNKSVTSNPGG